MVYRTAYFFRAVTIAQCDLVLFGPLVDNLSQWHNKSATQLMRSTPNILN